MPRGYLTITHTDKNTGDVVSVHDDFQIITAEGTTALMKRFSSDTANESGAYFWNIMLGDDVGSSGTPASPQNATQLYSSADQNVVYEIPNGDITFSEPSPHHLRMNTVMDGAAIIASEQPASGSIKYSSATMRFFDGTVFAAKRFPTVIISNSVSIEITWTIAFEEVIV